MKKYIFAAVFVLLALIIILTDNNHAEAQTGTSSSTTSVTAAESPPPQLTTTTAATAAATTVPLSEAVTTQRDYANEIVRTAEALTGIPFNEGGSKPSEGFDNSGFIYYVLRENGYISFPRKIKEQIEWGPSEEFDEIRAGDILYFSDEPSGEASFGGIYAGDGMMIYCPYPGESVKTTDITSDYWQSRFVTAISL